MGSLKYLIVLILVSQTFSAETKVSRAFEREGIVPDLINKAPRRLVQVAYSDEAIVHLGNKISVLLTKEQPSFIDWDANPRRNYTLAMVGNHMANPDVLSRSTDPILREVKHWLVVNIPGNNLSEGTTLTSFLAPAPPPGTGSHRYIFLIYLQPTGQVEFNETPVIETADRFNFSIRQFARKYRLTLFAGNFNTAQTTSLDIV